MIKVIMYAAKAIAIAIAALFFSSCNFNGTDGSGNVVTQNRSVAGKFTAVSVSGGLEVFIEQGSKTSIVVEADDNLQQHIKTELSGNELKIYCDVNIHDAGATRITVTLPEIKSIEAAAGSSVKSKTILKNDSFSLTTDSGSSMEVAVDSQKVNCEADSGSSLVVSGTTEDLQTDSGSGSSLDAKELKAKTVTASSGSGSTTQVNVTASLTAEASSGSSISFTGKPTSISKKESSGGSVSQD